MPVRFAPLVGLFAVLALSACAPGFPKNGAPSPFDGKWAGVLETDSRPCHSIKITAAGEIRYGYLIGEVFERGTKKYDIWGQIGPDNRLDADIGVAGIAGAGADILFEGNGAQGTWKSSSCEGTVSLSRQ